jgi:nitrate/nitrite-specific signal transduction histidine kinase
MAWLREMREMRHEQQKERTAQTDAFVAAMDRLGGRVDANITEMRLELRRHLNVLVTTFVLSFVVLAALAGATVYFKGFGITATTAAASAPPP